MVDGETLIAGVDTAANARTGIFSCVELLVEVNTGPWKALAHVLTPLKNGQPRWQRK